jgi:hypothetical protein
MDGRTADNGTIHYLPFAHPKVHTAHNKNPPIP